MKIEYRKMFVMSAKNSWQKKKTLYNINELILYLAYFLTHSLNLINGCFRLFKVYIFRDYISCWTKVTKKRKYRKFISFVIKSHMPWKLNTSNGHQLYSHRGYLLQKTVSWGWKIRVKKLLAGSRWDPTNIVRKKISRYFEMKLR